MKKWITILLIFSLLAFVGIGYAVEEKKPLILYFDYSENIDTTGLDADAVSQASIAGTRARDTSNLLVMVDVLKERLDADVYSLRVCAASPPQLPGCVPLKKRPGFPTNAFRSYDYFS